MITFRDSLFGTGYVSVFHGSSYLHIGEISPTGNFQLAMGLDAYMFAISEEGLRKVADKMGEIKKKNAR